MAWNSKRHSGGKRKSHRFTRKEPHGHMQLRKRAKRSRNRQLVRAEKWDHIPTERGETGTNFWYWW
jgi:hypothetical protein